MIILIAHNYYQQPGGEDQVFASEAGLLEARGHRVVRFTRSNDEIDGMGRPALFAATLWNRRLASELGTVIRAERPEVVHFHNTFPLISPAAYAAARAEGCAVVQTLHNYRLMCPNALFLRDGQACERCLARPFAWPGVIHGCYRESCTASAVVATMTAAHRAVGTYGRLVDRYIAPSEFARRKFVLGGLPPEKIVVKPNFVAPDPGPGEGRGGYALFVGRLSRGKGLETLLAAWPRLHRPFPLKIIGDGDLADLARDAAWRWPHVQWLGHRAQAEVTRIIGEATLVVVPSECYETFGRVAIEAFAKGTPVVAADHGAVAEIVGRGDAGRVFNGGCPDDLARQVDALLDTPATLTAMRPRARQEFEARYTAAENYEQLMAVYQQALEPLRSRRVGVGVGKTEILA
jgi:glycosyltransferase involved in cell wall biosynthesis